MGTIIHLRDSSSLIVQESITSSAQGKEEHRIPSVEERAPYVYRGGV